MLSAWILYGMFLFRWPWFHGVLDTGVSATGTTGGLLHVRVIGEVHHPGLYSFHASSTVLHAIAAAGGPTASADLCRLNLLASLMQDTVLRVPSVRSGFQPVVSINRSMAQELMRVPGIGPKLAARIVAYRAQKGRFRTPEDLLKIRGIGKEKLRRIMRHAILN